MCRATGSFMMCVKIDINLAVSKIFEHTAHTVSFIIIQDEDDKVKKENEEEKKVIKIFG